ncbi:YhjD/YihY/BrkB family envelope integrity protein [Nakamurella sp. A5-74]|uniref:YhjD/YihY/BrkB family envelope integrity protein n=1 Tax=Nakamurella sp. A5-74 TaxID=3158264 RepID=A0AAU8DUH8_9ACTN
MASPAPTSLEQQPMIPGPDGRDPFESAKVGVGKDEPEVKKDPTRIQRLLAKPWLKHVIAAFSRFNDRLAPQFAGAITYFSFLALVPILMVAFGITAIVLRGNQGALDTIREKAAEQIPGDLTTTIIDGALDSGKAIGIVGLVIAIYSGVSWMGNVREAVQAQWRPTFEKNEEEKAQSIVSFILQNLVTMFSLAGALLVSLVLTTVGGAAQSFVLGLLGLDNISWLKPLVAVVTFAIVIAADVLIFMWFYRRMEIDDFTPAPGAVFKGAVIVAVVFEVLKLAMTFVFPLMTGSAAFTIFGPILLLLFFFNLVAQVVLFVAAWIATAPGAADERTNDLPEIPGPVVVVHNDGPVRTAGMVGAGALAGFLAGMRRRRR